MFNRVDYVMVTVSDMGRSVEFYRHKLGVLLKFESPDWTEFETGATTLALHGGGKPSPLVAVLGAAEIPAVSLGAFKKRHEVIIQNVPLT